MNGNFIEDVVDEPQAILKSILSSINTSKIIEIWKIHRIGGLSNKDNLGTSFEKNIHNIVPQRNRFGIAFSTAKTAVNIALETKSDNELIQLLKTFILAKQNSRSKDNFKKVQSANNNGIIALQQNLIDETNDPHVTKIRGAPNKKRIKSL
ncbi:protein far1-related sequence 5-like [Gigaspora margarita]|uniref:Protein far1-related sequence 5-like n=1 Tax=Gigaspora margarita TaxID=4874 RepID=A0A8H3XFT0_GIGMA|nr:protein far1-related sequence 5-like [Gigaspora margarita]